LGAVLGQLGQAAGDGWSPATTIRVSVGVRVIESIDEHRYDTSAAVLAEMSHRYQALPGEGV